MAKSGVRAVLFLALLSLVPACSAKTSAERAGIDQEIARNILWRFHQDGSGRFRDVQVTCEDRVIVLEGRVPDAKSAADAIQIALGESRGGKVDSRLQVRAR